MKGIHSVWSVQVYDPPIDLPERTKAFAHANDFTLGRIIIDALEAFLPKKKPAKP